MTDASLIDPRTKYPTPPFPDQPQAVPGVQSAMNPVPDCGEQSYVGSGKLNGRKAIITGGDSGIGRAVAIAYAREGADILISYLSEHQDAAATAELVRKAGRNCVLVAGDIQEHAQCQAIVQRAVDELGGVDILVNNAAFQMAHKDLQEFSAEELDRTFRTNVFATFFLTQAAVPHMPPGSSTINTVSINADKPNATLVAYAATKGALQNLTGGLAQLLAENGIRVNWIAPGECSHDGPRARIEPRPERARPTPCASRRARRSGRNAGISGGVLYLGRDRGGHRRDSVHLSSLASPHQRKTNCGPVSTVQQ